MSSLEEASKDKGKTYNTIVNGRPRVVDDDDLSYRQAVRLAYPDATDDESILHTVSYANPHGKDGTLVEGQKVRDRKSVV